MSSHEHIHKNNLLTPLNMSAPVEKFDSIHDSAAVLAEHHPQITCISVDSSDGLSAPFLSMINGMGDSKD
jgi:hypothetical protein